MWTRGTIELLKIPALAQGSTRPYAWFKGSIWGMKHAEKLSISLIGSFKTSGTITASIYSAVDRSPGSIDAAALGSISVGRTATGVAIRTKTFTQLSDYPFLAVKLAHGGGSFALGLGRVIANFQY